MNDKQFLFAIDSLIKKGYVIKSCHNGEEYLTLTATGKIWIENINKNLN